MPPQRLAGVCEWPRRMPFGLFHAWLRLMDYARLVHAAWDEGGQPLKVYAPAPMQHINERFFGRDGAFAHDLIARTEHTASQEVWLARGGDLPRPWPNPSITEVVPGFKVEGDNWSLSSCRVPHAQPQLECMAFRIESNNSVFVFSGDAALCDELESLAKEADVLLHWCYRLDDDKTSKTIAKMSPSPKEIGELAHRCNVKSLCLTHLRTAMDTEEIKRHMVESAASEYAGSVKIAEDLMQISLPQHIPSTRD